jgi:ferredoxin
VAYSRPAAADAPAHDVSGRLDLADACDVPVGFGCRTGVCHNCESGLLAGAVAYNPDPLEPPADGRILVCCSRPSSELTLDL